MRRPCYSRQRLLRDAFSFLNLHGWPLQKREKITGVRFYLNTVPHMGACPVRDGILQLKYEYIAFAAGLVRPKVVCSFFKPDVPAIELHPGEYFAFHENRVPWISAEGGMIDQRPRAGFLLKHLMREMKRGVNDGIGLQENKGERGRDR